MSAYEMLSEHQGSEPGPTPAVDNMTDEDKKALKLLNKTFDKNKRAREKFDQNWIEYNRFFRGKQWSSQRPSYRHAEVINMVFQNIQASVPIMTDSRPRIEFVPQEPSDQELSDILNKLVDSDFVKGNWLDELTQMLYDSHVIGTGCGCVGYDKEADYNLGAIKFESGDPFYLYPDANARSLESRCKNVVYAEPMDVDEIKRRHPDKKEFIKPDLQDLSNESREDLGEVIFKSPTDRTVPAGESPLTAGRANQALLLTGYFTSDEYEEEEKTAEDGTVSYVQKLKYPNGRKIVGTTTVLLEDGPNPYDDGKFPYIRLINYINPRQFWGISDVEQIKSPQQIFNKLISFSLDVLTLMGNPIWKVPNTAGIDTDNLYNRPGLILEYDGETPPTREEGVQLQPYVLQLIDRMKQWFDDISGSNDVSRGIKPENISAGVAIQALQEAGQTRIRQKSRNLDSCLQSFGQLYVSRVFQYYSVPRIVRVTNDQGANNYFKFHVEQTEDAQKNKIKTAKVRDFIVGPDGQQKESLDLKEYQIRGSFDVVVNTGSLLPFVKAQNKTEALELFKLGILDEEELLTRIEYPNKERVLARLEQKKAELAQQQTQPPGPAQPPVAQQ